MLLGEGCVEGGGADKMKVLAVETRSCAEENSEVTMLLPQGEV